MELDVKWKDIVAYHYDQCNKRFSLLRYYFYQEKSLEGRTMYKYVMHSIINQHKEHLLNHALEKEIHHDKIDFKWADDLHAKINHLHDFPSES